MTDNADELLTLREASEQVFGGRVGIDALKARAAEGKLNTYRPGRQLLTTRRDCLEMIERCRVEKARPASTSTRKGKPTSSATERDSYALASINNILQTRKTH